MGDDIVGRRHTWAGARALIGCPTDQRGWRIRQSPWRSRRGRVDKFHNTFQRLSYSPCPSAPATISRLRASATACGELGSSRIRHTENCGRHAPATQQERRRQPKDACGWTLSRNSGEKIRERFYSGSGRFAVAVRWGFDTQFADLVQQGFVADLEYLCGLATIPSGLLEHVGDHFLFDLVHGALLDFLE